MTEIIKHLYKHDIRDDDWQRKDHTHSHKRQFEYYFYMKYHLTLHGLCSTDVLTPTLAGAFTGRTRLGRGDQAFPVSLYVQGDRFVASFAPLADHLTRFPAHFLQQSHTDTTADWVQILKHVLEELKW